MVMTAWMVVVMVVMVVAISITSYEFNLPNDVKQKLLYVMQSNAPCIAVLQCLELVSLFFTLYELRN